MILLQHQQYAVAIRYASEHCKIFSNYVSTISNTGEGVQVSDFKLTYQQFYFCCC